MLEVEGKYNKAIIYSDIIDEITISQIKDILDNEMSLNSKIRIMADCHAGASCVIGTTITLTDKVIPNVVGVDIGCGVLCLNLGKITINLNKFDEICHQIPSGKNINELDDDTYNKVYNYLISLKCFNELEKIKWLVNSLGSLGRGNHFIELDKDDNDNIYLLIHTGSRNLGLQVANIYQDIAAYKNIKLRMQKEYNDLLNKLKVENRFKEIEEKLKLLRERQKEELDTIDRDMAYLSGLDLENYLEDIKICQNFARYNRLYLAKNILDKYFNINLKINDNELVYNDYKIPYFQSIHNYIDLEDKIIRKGAIRAYLNEPLLIPINMRDGVIIGEGLSNPDYNFSAPHGAGRIMSRKMAKESLKLEEFENEMKGIYTTTCNNDTIDEAPMAYKPIDVILNNIKETVKIEKIIKPIYNFKACE